MGTNGYSEAEHNVALDRLSADLEPVRERVESANPCQAKSLDHGGERPAPAQDQPLVRLGQGDFETTIMPGDVSLRRGALLRYFKARKGRR